MSLKFTFSNKNKTFLLDDLINDFLNNGFNVIFSADKLPSGYLPYKTDFETILKLSSCDKCDVRPTLPPGEKTTTKPDVNLNDRVRLPNNYKPISYDLKLSAYFQPESTNPDDSIATNYYTGQVGILFELTNNTKSIVFHADSSLKLNSVKLYRESYHIPEEIASSGLERLEYQLVRLNLVNEITIGNYKLDIAFSNDYGPSSNLVGFYRTKYVENGIT